MGTWLVLLHAISLNLNIMTIISVLIQLCLTINLGIQNTACLTNLFSRCSCCVETCHLICSAYQLAGFFTVGMATDRVFRVGYTISFFVSLALSLLDFLRLLLIIFKYLVYLLFFIKCFFDTQDCAFPVIRGLVDYPRSDLGVMFIDFSSWALRLFLNIPLFIGKSFIFKDAG